MVPECHTCEVPYKCCHMVAEKCSKQVPYTVCKPVHYTKTIQVLALRAEAGCLHGHPLRAEGGLQGSAGAGLLPVPRAILPERAELRLCQVASSR